MLSVQAPELVIGDLHELCGFTLIAICLLKCTLYKAFFQSILGLIKTIKGKTLKRKLLLARYSPYTGL